MQFEIFLRYDDLLLLHHQVEYLLRPCFASSKIIRHSTFEIAKMVSVLSSQIQIFFKIIKPTKDSFDMN